MGGGIALKLACDWPARVGRVVVSRVGDAALNRLDDPREIAAIHEAFEADSADAVALPTAHAIRRAAERGGNDLKALTPFLRNGGWPGGLDAERPVTAPVLVVVADEDQYMGEVIELLRWLGHAQFVCASGCDHYTVLDDAAVRRAVLDFLGADTDARPGAVRASGAD